MKVMVMLSGKKRAVEFSGGGLPDLLRKLGVNRETVIARRKDEIMLDDERIKDGDSIELIKVVSGG
jgi:sulfur carrier protein